MSVYSTEFNDKIRESAERRKEMENALRNYCMTTICDQVKHEYDTEEEFEEKYGSTDTIEQVVELYCELKIREDQVNTARDFIESFPEEEDRILSLFEMDREDLGLDDGKEV